jgi:hypothetical protein
MREKGVTGMITLKWTLKKQCVHLDTMSSRYGPTVGSLEPCNEFRLPQKPGISGPAQRMSAFKKGICPMDSYTI